MPYDEFLKVNLLRTDYLVIIRLRYDHEKEWRKTVEILEYDPTSDTHFWMSDWHEGEQHIEIDTAVPTDYITVNMIGRTIIKAYNN